MKRSKIILAGIDTKYSISDIDNGRFKLKKLQSDLAEHVSRFTKRYNPDSRIISYLRKRAEEFRMELPIFLLSASLIHLLCKKTRNEFGSSLSGDRTLDTCRAPNQFAYRIMYLTHMTRLNVIITAPKAKEPRVNLRVSAKWQREKGSVRILPFM
jgi:hypothetical protein